MAARIPRHAVPLFLRPKPGHRLTKDGSERPPSAVNGACANAVGSAPCPATQAPSRPATQPSSSHEAQGGEAQRTDQERGSAHDAS